MSLMLEKLLTSLPLRLLAVCAGVALIAYAVVFPGPGDVKSDPSIASVSASRIDAGRERPTDKTATANDAAMAASKGTEKVDTPWLGENPAVARQLAFLARTYAQEELQRDFTDVIAALRARAEAGSPAAQFLLGHAYGDGMGVLKDTQTMANWYARAEQAALRGADVADPLPANYSEAFASYRAAAEKGDAAAALYMGLAYDLGRGVLIDRTVAASWYREAAAQGSASAACNLGVLYHEGGGVSKDGTEAMNWLERAARGGSLQAQFNLGRLYAEGVGAAKDDAKAAQWLERAANAGYEPAEVLMSEMYASGQGVPGNTAKAYMWISLAAQTDGRARDSRDEVARSMSFADLSEGQRLTQEWMFEHPKSHLRVDSAAGSASVEAARNGNR